MSDSLTSPQPQTITFNEIPGTIRDPNTYVEVRPNYGEVGLLGVPTKAIVLSQMIASGTATPGVIYPITGNGQGGALFGHGSVAARQIAKFRLNNTTTPLFAACVADTVGTSIAQLPIVFAGGPLTSGISFTIAIGGTPVNVSVPAGATAAACASAFTASVSQIADLPVAVATDVAGTVTIGTKFGGFCGNEIDVRLTYRSDAAMPQVSIGIGGAGTATQAMMTGGAGSPDISSLIAAIAGQWFTDIIVPWTDATNRGELTAELVRRYGALVNLDARAYVGTVGSYGTVVGFGDAGNCIQLVQVGVRGNLEPGWEWAAAWAGVHSFRLANDPSRQSRGIAVAGLTAPSPGDQWLPQERDLLLNNGISTWTALADGTVVIGRTITGYLTSNLGVADAAWLDVMTPAVMTRLRYDWRAYSLLVYPQAKLFDDDAIGAEYDNTAVTPKRMRATWAKRCLDYERAGWIENTADTVQQSYFVRNANDRNRLDMDVVVQVAGNLIIEAVVLEFAA